ncbi:hypothetical protein V9T40_010984 [Parthenolecanium corni]|uniref:Ubiquitin carboxyl-terminal hydrolase n=1 Tax=Parthenolecanium corni TaxID=536013 RepID=A0AAN9XZ18_9HEMI
MPEPVTEKLKYSSIDELMETATIKGKFNLTEKSLIDGIDKCFANAEKYLEEGDEELSYIFCTRILNLHCAFQKSKNSKNFKNADMKYIKLSIGSKVSHAVQYLEKLHPDLLRKYEQKKQLEALSVENKQKSLINEQDDSLHNKLTKQSANQSLMNGIQSPPSGEEKSSKFSITSTELYNFIHGKKPCSTLILDIRLKKDFEESSMMVKDVVNIPEDIISPSNIASKLESLIEPRFRPFFSRRGEYDRVIVVDWSSKSYTNSSSKVLTMLKVLKQFDINMKYKSIPVMLEGGYEDWLSRYPALTTNALVSPPKESVNNKFLLEKINYPSNVFLEPEKVEKPPAAVAPPSSINLSSTPKPSFDRSTKPAKFPEKKPESADEPKEKPVESAVKIPPSVAADENHITRIVVKNEEPQPVPSTSMNGRRESMESDEEELQKQYHRNGRRSALTQNEVQSPLLNRKNREEIGESSRTERLHDNDETFRGKKAVNNIYNELGMKMKRYSSTPNISELGIDESSRPVIDRSTKPSNDDQLNYYTTGCTYNEIGKGLTGLRNIGNTCYMNSILQCLSNTDPLRKKLCSWDIRAINEKSKTRGAVAREVISIMKQLWSGDGGYISCKSLKNIIGQYNDMFSGHDQQDSHEFLTILMDWLHEDLNEPPTRQNLDGADEKSGEKAWGEFISKNNSIIRKLFYGQLRSTVSCNVCQEESVTFEPFSNLSLSLPPEEIDKCTLSDCLKLYVSSDEIDKWQCPGCKELRRATKKLDITKLPPLLVIHFKRFTSVGGCKKQRTFVDFPDSLNMRPYIVGHEHRHQQYQLYAVSNHSGSMESGHYTAHCKNPADRRWYEFDDQNVYPMNSMPKSREAYIVFYQTVKN